MAQRTRRRGLAAKRLIGKTGLKEFAEKGAEVYSVAQICYRSGMVTDDESAGIPLAEVLRAANGLVAAGLVEDYALGGALAAIYYVEPFSTYDADIFFIPKEKGLTAGIPAIMVRGFPVQFLAASGLTEEAVREAERIEFEGVPARIFSAEHIVAIAAGVGRQKDKARIELLLQQAGLDKTKLEKILQRHKLKLP